MPTARSCVGPSEVGLRGLKGRRAANRTREARLDDAGTPQALAVVVVDQERSMNLRCRHFFLFEGLTVCLSFTQIED